MSPKLAKCSKKRVMEAKTTLDDANDGFVRDIAQDCLGKGSLNDVRFYGKTTKVR